MELAATKRRRSRQPSRNLGRQCALQCTSSVALASRCAVEAEDENAHRLVAPDELLDGRDELTCAGAREPTEQPATSNQQPAAAAMAISRQASNRDKTSEPTTGKREKRKAASRQRAPRRGERRGQRMTRAMRCDAAQARHASETKKNDNDRKKSSKPTNQPARAARHVKPPPTTTTNQRALVSAAGQRRCAKKKDEPIVDQMCALLARAASQRGQAVCAQQSTNNTRVSSNKLGARARV